ncbi:multicopper oxidase family protein [Filobacillus milosensis]|uniref:Copper-containing nitrite reductase n=1 Tax=Filobacillus milosensis TaxID=94137 RepID=A0A4Y8IST5_9BACI|nr:multicopper oxidase family protein [Filobacillus milosensis]TFB25008.1 multicopper oxidase family protein [Filobacillus milosensis]
MKKKLIGFIFIAALLFIGYFSSNWFFETGKGQPNIINGETSIVDLNNNDFSNKNVTEYNLKAEEVTWSIDQGKKVSAWTYNGKVPGEPLRVTEGDVLKVNLNNELDVPVTIHWHGVVLPNAMDGVPDLTQEAVQPGESITYEFAAEHPGTYWYHSHKQSSIQVDKGLYGSLVVEEKGNNQSEQNEQILILDEWSTDGERESITNMPGMMMGSMNGDGEADTKQMYDTYTVNGKSGDSVKPIVIKEGEKSRFRIINAGYQVHKLKFPKDTVKVLAYDAAKTMNQKESYNIVEIAPGERVDLEVTNNQSNPWFVNDVTEKEKGKANVNIPIVTDENADYSNVNPNNNTQGSKIDGTAIGSEQLIFDQTPTDPDVNYVMDLSMGMNMGEGMVFQINNEIYPDTPPIQVEEGDIVKVEVKNNGRLNHPMHLHGHRFQVVSKNGKSFKNPMVKDLINVKPGETFEIYFKADNKGEWLFHCHDNNHADRGMITIVDYKSVFSPFVE